jgi:S-layer protein (TIGR01567 family)
MEFKKYVRTLTGLLLFLTIISLASGTITIDISTPPGTNITTLTTDPPQSFFINITHPANVTWTINDHIIPGTFVENVTTSSYINSTANLGNWIIKAEAKNTSSASDIATRIWYWNVTNPPPIIPGIDTFSPPGDIITDLGVPQEFNATFTTSVSVNWTVNGNIVQPNGTVSQGTLVRFSNISTYGVYDVRVIGTNNNGSAYHRWNWTVKDLTPPASITNLTMESNGTTWIKWNWTNPLDSDFSRVMIFIDGIFKTNVTSPDHVFNASLYGFLSATSHMISTHTVDTSGNINATWMNLTNSTLPNTLASVFPVTVVLQNSIVTFNNVTTTGNTIESPNATSLSDYIPVGNIIDIKTDAVVTAPITVKVKYDIAKLPQGYAETEIKLLHWNDTTIQWENVTSSVDRTNDMVVGTVTRLSPFVPVVFPKPIITVNSPPISTLVETDYGISQTFNIKISQNADVTWKFNGNIVGTNTSIAGASFDFNYQPGSASATNVFSATASNPNGSHTVSWNWTVHPKTYSQGNRIWDGCNQAEFSKTYSWNVMSFSGFYYNIDDNVGSEQLQITMPDYSSRSIPAGNILYSTQPQSVSFQYDGFGKYQVMGFMADKYFAGYTSETNISNPRPKTNFDGLSALSNGKLHKVLFDDDTKRTISVGSTLTLQEGYVLKAKDIDLNARKMWLGLLKDGNEVDSVTLASGETYIYTPSGSTIPTIFVRFDDVFSGTEMQVAFIVGLFQISEVGTQVQSGNQFKDMKVTSVSKNGINMTNSNTVSLDKGHVEDLMGNLKIVTADNTDDCVRFALSVENTGNFEVRSTIFNADDQAPVTVWTPYNFGLNIGKTSIGFYYNLDDGIGTENINLKSPLPTVSTRTIPDTNLEYTTTPADVSFTYTDFGKYKVVGFMAEKYFAGYSSNTFISNPRPKTDFSGLSSISSGRLHKVLIDDDTQRTISVGSTLTLQEGYVLKAKDIDLNARRMWLALLKDGNEIDSVTLGSGETYIYTPPGSNIPIIFVRFDDVFSGTEMQVAFIKGLFQISNSPLIIKSGDHFGKMMVRGVGQTITMSNDGSIGLDKARNDILMGNIRLKVANTDSALRFYFAVDVTPDMVANQLVLDSPAKAMAGDNILIKVTAGGKPVEGASVTLDGDIGKTNSSGLVNYTIPKNIKGIYNITATIMGYALAKKDIEIEKYIDLRLTLDAPAKAVQFETISIKISYNGSIVNGATVKFDNQTLGVSDSTGILNYTLQTTGTHALSASKTSYVSVSRDIDIAAPFSDFKAVDFNISPVSIFTNENVVIRSNITNAGNKKDTRSVELKMNGTAVSNVTLTLGPGDKKEINFTRKESKAGNYTFEIAGTKGVYVVKDKPLNLLLVGGILTLIGIGAIYVLTAKGMINIDRLKEQFNSLIKSGKK